ncbi:BTAD domain-containing putative transcriptional regulator [Nocardiopsis metallicus]|uniref:Putative ATPase/DNA-binding SARP family transcriptional activator n=1 Tax=Nocardiopsis metallicus TaxID=179819 RepID=A0A840W4D8_9ACTN|nr:BTAD domain-containing putative transcriptional regulator [Nocardiopsis metallicus]MBB5490932.1 putative ATPase/DNA-binding SARP family transcriptional activator [Nocardiopsis metallicus]
MRFGVLGPVAVWTEPGERVTVPGRKVRALLASLILAEGRPVSPSRLIEDIWEGSPPENPSAALHAKVSQLRRALEQAETGARELVALRDAGYLLAVRREGVDAWRFLDLVNEARGQDAPAARAKVLTRALDLWRGPAYADFEDESVIRASASRLDEERVEALEARAEALVEAGEHARVIGELEELVVRYPLRERLRAAQMTALYHAGRRSEALDSYARLRSRLAEEFGLEPGERLRDLQGSILRGDLFPAHAPGPKPSRTPRALSRALTRLVGRDGLLDDLRRLLVGHRLITLVGPGGVGKTRLALEVAALEADAGRDVVYVELADLATSAEPSDTGPLVAKLALALDLRKGTGPVTAEEAVVAALAGRDVLLVVDNGEHVVEPLAALLGGLLGYVPEARVLLTSREPLALPPERRYQVPPLDLPDPEAAPDPDSAARSPAVRLFVERAAAACHGFTLDWSNAADVVALCRRLDGLPLALELAASRVCSLGVAEVLERLDGRFHLLDSARAVSGRRRRTLRAVIDWSWDLLGDDERAVLRRLSVFSGGCDLASAEAVCSGGGVRTEAVAGALARLVDRSLVTSVRPDGGAGVRGTRRFGLLETISAYAAERLDESGEREPVSRRHWEHQTSLVRRTAPQLRGSGQREALARLDAESSNFRVALESALRMKEAGAAWELAEPLTWYWMLRGRMAEGRDLLHRLSDQAAALPPAPRDDVDGCWLGLALLDGAGADTDGRVGQIVGRLLVAEPACSYRTLWFLAHALLSTGGDTAGEPLAERALVGARESGDRWTEAAASCVLAGQALSRGDLAAARGCGEQGRQLFSELGDDWGVGHASFVLASLSEAAGDYDRARELHRDSARRARNLGMWPEEADAVTGLARLDLLEKDYAGAREHHERAVRLAVDCGYKVGELFARIGLGLGARREGEYEQAREHLDEVLAWNRRSEVDTDVVDSLLLVELGLVAEVQGRVGDGLRLQEQGYAAAARVGDPRALALSLEGIASAMAAKGRHTVSARLLGAAHATRESVGAPLPDAENGDVRRVEGVLRRELGDASFEVVFAEGRGLEPGQAFALACPGRSAHQRRSGSVST